MTSSLVRSSSSYSFIKLPAAIPSTNGLIKKNISNGQEPTEIPVINVLDDETLENAFEYISARSDVIRGSNDDKADHCCQCEDGCNSENCPCTLSNELEISFKHCPYDTAGLIDYQFLEKGLLTTIRECSSKCNSGTLCLNNVAQSGIRYKMAVVKTFSRGWSLTALETIPKGAFICEYVGEMISNMECDERVDDSYIFETDVGCSKDPLMIDAKVVGNVGRFINHSCDPNLISLQFYTKPSSRSNPRIAFFANREIQKNEDFCFDYGENFWAVKCLEFKCACGTKICRYSNANDIYFFLEQYLKFDC